MSIRLISTTPLSLHVMRRSSVCLSIIHARLLTMITSLLHSLIRTSRNEFLSVITTSAAARFLGMVISGTAADREGPEEATRDAEYDCQPSCSQERSVDVGSCSIGLRYTFDCARCDAGFDGGHDRSSNDGCGR